METQTIISGITYIFIGSAANYVSGPPLESHNLVLYVIGQEKKAADGSMLW